MLRSFILFTLIAFSLHCNANITQYYPKNNETISSDNFYFICQCNEEYSTLTLEIAKSIDFEDIIFRNSTRWLTVDGGWIQFPMSPAELGNGTFYWRVCYDNNYTPTMSFVITGQSETSDKYTIIRDNNEYPPISINGYESPLVLSSLWCRSENTSNGLCQIEKGGYNRGIALKDNIIYISHCDIINNIPHLKRYNAETGETLDSIFIDYGDFEKPERALSCIDIDDAGNIYAINTGDISSSFNVDLTVDVLTISNEEATVTKRYTCTLPTNMDQQYINFAKAIGNVETGDFTLYSALERNSSTAVAICSWTFTPSVSIIEAKVNKKLFSISNAENTRVYPLDATSNYYIYDNSSILPAICKGTSQKGDFSKEASFNVTSDYSGNGLHIFKHGNIPMLIYGCNFKTEGSKFELITLHPNFLDGSSNQVDTFEGIKSLWKFPTTFLGSVTSTNNSTLATSSTQIGSNGYPQTKLYIYSAGNGLAAYQLSHYTTTYIDGTTCNNLTWSIANRKINFSSKCDSIEIFNINGLKISHQNNVKQIDTSDLHHGVYIIKADDYIFKLLI